jgi:hypothetical protein
MRFSYRTYVIMAATLACVVSLFIPGAVQAQHAAYLPLVQGETVRLPSQPARFIIRSTSKTLTFTYPLSGPHALNLTGELFRAASLPRAFYKLAGLDPDWKFYSYPLTFAYSYQLPVRSTRFLPIVTAGVTAHFTRAYRLLDASHQPIGPLTRGDLKSQGAFYTKAYGVGYGAEVSVGFRTVMNKHLFLLTQCRYRLVHSTPFAGSSELGMHFSVLDFAIGAGFTL